MNMVEKSFSGAFRRNPECLTITQSGGDSLESGSQQWESGNKQRDAR